MTDKRITDVDFTESLYSNDSFFINQNNAIKQISKSDIVFNVENGGTGAKTANEARANLGAITVYHEYAILLVEDWVDNQQVVDVEHVSMDNTVIVNPSTTEYNYDAYIKYGVHCVAQEDGALTFACKEVPDIMIAVNVAVLS